MTNPVARPRGRREAGVFVLVSIVLFVVACGGGESIETEAAVPEPPAELIDRAGADNPGAEPAQPVAAAELLYVASQSGPALSVIDMNAREVVETIWLTDLGFTANAKPHDVAVEPDGSFWYASLIGDGRVLKFNRDNELVGQAEFETPGLLAVDPVENILYVGRSMAAVNPPQRIGVLTRDDMAIDEYDVFFPRPHAIAVAPGGGRAH